MVQKNDVLKMARLTKLVFLDQIIALIISIGLMITGFALEWVANPGWYIGPMFLRLWGIIFFFVSIIALIWFFVELVRYLSIELALTSFRIIGKKGVIAIDILDSQLVNIDSIKVQFTILGRILGYGSLTVITRNKDYQYRRISRPMAFQRAVNERIEIIKRDMAAGRLGTSADKNEDK